MPVRLRCPKCSTNVVAPDELRGKVVRCPKCRETFRAENNASPSGVRQAPPSRPAPPILARPALATVRRTAPAQAPRGSPRPPDRRSRRGGWRPRIARRRRRPRGVAAVAAFSRQPDSGSGHGRRFSRAPTLAAAPWPADGEPFHLSQVRKGVVYISCFIPGAGPRTGSGFLVSKDGLVATNRHVIQPKGAFAPPTLLMVGVPSPADPDRLDYFKAEVAFCARKNTETSRC